MALSRRSFLKGIAASFLVATTEIYNLAPLEHIKQVKQTFLSIHKDFLDNFANAWNSSDMIIKEGEFVCVDKDTLEDEDRDYPHLLPINPVRFE